tara:strand:- start:70 stop:2046 length:1977 start_codon:yes stop_codon:yes gene_type:complete
MSTLLSRIVLVICLLSSNLFAQVDDIEEIYKSEKLKLQKAKKIYKSDPLKALNIVDEILSTVNEEKDRALVVHCYNTKGIINNVLGLREQSIMYYEKVIDISKRHALHRTYVMGLNNFAVLYESSGNYDESEKLIVEALEYAHKYDQKEWFGVLRFNLVDSKIRREEYDSAIALLNSIQSLSVDEILHLSKEDKIIDPKDKDDYAYVMTAMADILIKMKRYDQAYEFFLEANKQRQETGLAHEQVKALNNLAEVSFLKDNYKEAIGYARVAYKIASIKQFKDELNESLMHLVQYFKRISNNDSLAKYQDELLSLRELLNEQKVSEKLFDLKLRDELQQKDTEYKIQVAQEIYNSKLSFWISVIIGCSLLMGLLLLYRTYLIKINSNAIVKAQNNKLNKTNKKITESIQYASRIQKAFMPEHVLLEEIFKDYFIYYKPKDIVSGDFYWASKIGDKCVFVVADCTGHGVPGSMVSMTGNSLLNEIVIQRKISEPAKILKELNKGLLKTFYKKDSKAMDGMDLSLISFDSKIKKLSYAGAMNPLIILKDKALTQIEATRSSMGGGGLVRPNTDLYNRTYEQKELELEEGMTFYMFTDGFIDQFGGDKKKKFGKRRFDKFLTDISEYSLVEQKSIVESKMSDWIQSSEFDQIDDMCLVGFRI